MVENKGEININQIAIDRWNNRSVMENLTNPIREQVLACCVNGDCPLHGAQLMTPNIGSLVSDLYNELGVPKDQRTELPDCVVCSGPMAINTTGEETVLIAHK